MNCCKSFYKYCEPVPSCLSTLGIVTPIIDGNVTILIRDKFDNIYTFHVETESNGLAIIDLTDENLPENLLNEFAGYFFLSFKGIHIDILGVLYDEIRFECANVTPKVESFTIDVYNAISSYY